MTYEDESTCNSDAYIARQICITKNKQENKSNSKMRFVTVELSDRLVGVRLDAALSFGDDAGVPDECVYRQSDLVHALPNRHGG